MMRNQPPRHKPTPQKTHCAPLCRETLNFNWLRQSKQITKEFSNYHHTELPHRPGRDAALSPRNVCSPDRRRRSASAEKDTGAAVEIQATDKQAPRENFSHSSRFRFRASGGGRMWRHPGDIWRPASGDPLPPCFYLSEVRNFHSRGGRCRPLECLEKSDLR